MKIAILDDYQDVALNYADWSGVEAKADVSVFRHNLKLEEAVQALKSFEVICTVRERMAMPAALLERLPNLKLIVITGPANRTLDLDAANRLGIAVTYTPYGPNAPFSTPELTWGLLLAVVRDIAHEDRHMRAGGWQTTVGGVLHGQTLGLAGLGRIGGQVARYGQAFGMKVTAWSPNLTLERASECGVERVDKATLFSQSDVVSVHLVLSERSRGLIGAADLRAMKPGAVLLNTSRGPIVQEGALIAALKEGRIRAGLDVFDEEPLPASHPLRGLANTVLTPHLGYVVEDTYQAFYEGAVECVEAYIAGSPVRLLNPEAL